jgi:phosphomannomutase/molybdopterin-guanine dinucleotide biosynthesis protein A
LLTQPLADSTVVEQSLQTLRAVVSDDSIVIVVAEDDDSVRQLLGPSWRYVVQSVPAGTGDAVRCARFELAGSTGQVLIAYADTPLISPSSLRGLINRHRLKRAQFSLLTALVDQPGEYGLVERDAAGGIVAITEASDASVRYRPAGPSEVNVGAYLAQAEHLLPQLDAMAAAGEHRLTELARRLIGQGVAVASYTIVDADELQGINSDQQLQAAADIVMKRLFTPHRAGDQSRISFGTGGWRAIIGEGFTLPNVRRLTQTLANQIIRQSDEAKGVVIGGDRRFLSQEASQAAAEVMAGNNIPVDLLEADVPTPLVTFAAPHLGSALGLVFTASHNPPQWNGLKVFLQDGSLPLSDQTDAWEQESNALTAADIVAVDLDLARQAGLIRPVDLTSQYIDAIEKVIDVEAMRRTDGLRIVVDPMYGTSQLTLGMILSDARCRVEFIHDRHNPLFGGRSPAPDPEALTTLITMMRSGAFDLGLATDGDADRIAIVDQSGRYIPTNDLLLLLYWYLHEVRGLRGGVVRNLATTHLLDRLADHFGEPHLETPVGFKHITAGMRQIDALIGGESSGGLTIRGHILGKDGIFACALVAEMLARTGQRVDQLLERVLALTGRSHSTESSIPATPQMRVEIPRRIARADVSSLAGLPVERVDTMDGIKFHLGLDRWALLRFSGTEPLLRLFVEADSPERASQITDWLVHFATA